MRGILICPDPGLRKRFEDMAAGHPNLALSKSLETYPAPDNFSRLVRIWAPEVVFMSFDEPEAASRACAQLDDEFPGLQRVAITLAPDPAAFQLALRLRMRGLLADPFEASEVSRVLNDVASDLAVHPPNLGCADRFYAFMPAKAGAGASTVAANLTRTFAATAGSHALLADFDLYSGVTGFLFNAEHEFSVSDALAMSNKLDNESWERVVKKVGNIDLLLSDAPHLDESSRNPKHLTDLLGFLRRSYSVVSADLPDAFNDTTLAVLREANRIFLVTTPELASLRLARQKAAVLRKLELEDRVSLIVNRVTKRMELSLDEIEATVGLPLLASIPSEYSDVTKSIREAHQPASLVPTFQQMAETMFNKRWHHKKTQRFVERFAVVPLRYSFR
jgi:pilus assembly protein CpaE